MVYIKPTTPQTNLKYQASKTHTITICGIHSMTSTKALSVDKHLSSSMVHMGSTMST